MSDFNSGLIDDLRANGGHASTGPFVGKQVLILTTTGAKSGQRRETPLAYSTEGDDIVIVASMGGAPRHPSWYHNLVANPNVQIEVDGTAYDATATVVDETERRRLYDAAHGDLPGLRRIRGQDRGSGHPRHRPAQGGGVGRSPDARLRPWRMTRPWSGPQRRRSSPMSAPCTRPIEPPGTRPRNATRAGSTRPSR